MPKKEEANKQENSKKEIPGWYKGYQISWLRKVRDEHPDGYLVDEYDALQEKDSEAEVSEEETEENK